MAINACENIWDQVRIYFYVFCALPDWPLLAPATIVKSDGG